jgi:hypothetical protein
MTEIGYYNYYNVQGRRNVDKPDDWYQKMVNQYESDDLRTKDEMLNPYSDLNKSTHALDEKLASWAEGIRTRFSNADDVDKYLCKKYFGQERIGYTMKDQEPEKYAMYKNDLNMVLYGTVRAYQFDLKDPRINNPQYTSADEYDKAEEKAKHDSISNNMAHLLENNGIDIGNNSLLFSINPYSKGVMIEGMDDLNMKSILLQALEKNNNSTNLLHYGMQNQNVDSDALTKYRAYSSLKEYTGLDLSELILKDGEYYTADGQSVKDLLIDGIDKATSVGVDFKGAAFNYVKDLLDKVAEKGWNAMPDLDIKIGYSKENGFFNFGTTYEV